MKLDEVDVNTILDVLRAVRKINSCGVGEFKIGDIVLDQVNNEYGIVLSIKPGPIHNDMFLKDLLKVNDRMEIAYYATNDQRPGVLKSGTLVLLTLTKSDGKITQEGTPDFRVRYTNTRNLKKLNVPLPLDRALKTSTGSSDLNYHCENECFLECTKECSLWKHRTNLGAKKT